jgi:hypothetical protein
MPDLSICSYYEKFIRDQRIAMGLPLLSIFSDVI